MDTNQDIKLETIFSSRVIPASGLAEYTVDNTKFTPMGFFSIHAVIAGSGTAKCEILASNNGTTFVLLSPEVFTGKTAGSYFYSYQLPLCQAFKIRFTETGGAQTITVTAYIAIQ